jgi:xanthine dehydrogenase accessory factor
MALLEALKSPAFYVGALGSRVNTAKRKERLGLFDLTQEQIERLKGPIGLFIGAKTPPEIAISILAEIIAAKYRVPLLQKRLIPTSELAQLAKRLDSLTTQVTGGVLSTEYPRWVLPFQGADRLELEIPA